MADARQRLAEVLLDRNGRRDVPIRDDMPPQELPGTEVKAYTPSARERLLYWLTDLTRSQGMGKEGAQEMAEKLTTASDFTPVGWGTAAYDVARSAAATIPQAFNDLFGSSPFDKAMTRDEYFAKNRKPTKSKDEYIKTELDAAKKGEDYQAAGPREKERILRRANDSAEKQYSGYLQSQTKAETDLETDWTAYKADQDRQRTEQLKKGFAERNPGVAKLSSTAGVIASALLARRGFNKIAREGEDILSAWKTADRDNNVKGMAEAATKAADFEAGKLKRQAGVVAKVAPIPAMGRAMGDVVDKYGLPDDSEAQKRASQRLSAPNLPYYLLEAVPGVLSGAESAGIGSLFANKVPTSGLRGATSYLRGLDNLPSKSPDQIAVELAQRRAAQMQSQRLLDEPGPNQREQLARLLSEPQQGGAPVPSATAQSRVTSSTAPESIGWDFGSPDPKVGQLPAPVASANQPARALSSPSRDPIPYVDSKGREGWRDPVTGHYTSGPRSGKSADIQMGFEGMPSREQLIQEHIARLMTPGRK